MLGAPQAWDSFHALDTETEPKDCPPLRYGILHSEKLQVVSLLGGSGELIQY